jgi:DNA-binding transcriptional LysR family regulator
MEIYQLRTFVTVARERSITRAAELLFLSQPAISAHIKAMEEELGISLFERTPKGMSPTGEGLRMLVKAESILTAHRELLDEARRLRGMLSGHISIGMIGNPIAQYYLGRLLSLLSDRYPEIEVTLRHGTSGEIMHGIREGSLDAGYLFDIESVESLQTIQIEEVGVYVALPSAWSERVKNGDWETLAALPWVCPAPNTFCGKVAEQLFEAHGIRPQRIICADQGSVTRVLISGGIGVGLLHGNSALEAERCGEVVLWQGLPQGRGNLVFAYDEHRAQESLVSAIDALVREAMSGQHLAK